MIHLIEATIEIILAAVAGLIWYLRRLDRAGRPERTRILQLDERQSRTAELLEDDGR